jgi:hypothetical protein
MNDWTHADDHDPPGADWIDVTEAGSPWEQQIDVGGMPTGESRWRHRHIPTKGPWLQGFAPKC